MQDDDEDIASNRLIGLKAIAKFRGEKPRRTQRLWELGLLPGVTREGDRLIGNKEAIRQAWREQFAAGRNQPEQQAGEKSPARRRLRDGVA